MGFLLLPLAAPLAHALERTVSDSLSEVVSIARDTFLAFRVSISKGEAVGFNVQVQAGGPIDVYLTDAENYSAYSGQASEFWYYKEYTKELTTKFGYTFSPRASGDYYMILDNQLWTTSGASPTGDVSAKVEISRGSGFAFPPLALYALVGAAAGGVFAAVIGVSRRRRAMRPLPPPQAFSPTVQIVDFPAPAAPVYQPPPPAPREDPARQP